MKLTAFLLLAIIFQATAAFSQKISLSVKNAPLEKVFAQIEKQSGYYFSYPAPAVRQAKPVTIDMKNANIEQVMDACLKNQSLTYTISEKIISVKAKVINRSGDGIDDNTQININGKVINEKGEPVLATVTVKGSNKAASTNTNGMFQLTDIPENATLLITGITIEPSEVKLSGRSELTLQVKTKITTQEEVTVSTGYQKISKERFVGSFSQLDSAAYARRAGMGILERLDGEVTGILFDKKVIGLGGPLANIQIRGISTISNGFAYSADQSPLIIVDNFPFRQNISAINPYDILTLTVLKDAAATSIWGAQAGNGVIVITTKKGKYNQPVNVSVNSNITVQQKPDLYYYPQMSVSDYIDAEIFLFSKRAYDADLGDNNTRPAITPVVEILNKKRTGQLSDGEAASQIDAMRELDLRRDYDKYVYRRAISKQSYVNINGGNNLFNYSLSGGYNRSENNIQHSKPDDQFTINTNIGLRLIKNLEIITGINFSQNKGRSAGFSLPTTYPYAQLADAAGNPLPVANGRRLAYIDTAGGGGLLDWRYFPLLEPGLTDRNDIIRTTVLNIGVSYRFNNWLSATVSYQYSNQSINNSNYQSPETYFTRDLVNKYTNLSQTTPELRNPIPVGGILDLSHSESTNRHTRAQVNFNKSFKNEHVITAFMAAEAEESKVYGDRNMFYGYNKNNGSSKPAIDYITSYHWYGSAGSERIPTGRPFPWVVTRSVSFVSNASYSYGGRYMVYASARKDGRNAFGVNANRKWKPLWSAGASWDISKEPFYKMDKWLSALRAKLSYGYSGNAGNGTSVLTLAYFSDPSYLTGLTQSGIFGVPNPDLRWEKVRTINEALDFGLFNGRISGSIDIWQKKVTDIISPTYNAPSTGLWNIIANTASLKGNGFDIGLNSTNIKGTFTWQTNVGFSHAKMIVTKLVFFSKYRAEDFITYGINPSVGKIAYGISSYRWAGLDPLTGDPRGYLGKQVSTDYRAIANDSVGNQVFHGSAQPLYWGFIRNSVSWKNVTLTANITYRLNFYFRKPSIDYRALINNGTGHADYALRWQQPGDEKHTNVPSFLYSDNMGDRVNFYKYAEINVLRGDNVRLQTIHLQYSWSNKNNRKSAFKSWQVSVSPGNLNLILWRKNKSGLDPDFTGGTRFIEPVSKTWTGTLNITF